MESIRKSKTTFAKSLGNSGAINTQITNTEIFIPNPIKLKLDAGNLIYAEYNSNSNPLNNSTNSVSAASLAYLAALDPTKAIYNPLTEIHQSYDQTNRSLTNTSQALIAVAAAAIAVGTEGIGTGISGAILTAGATTTGTIATTSATNASMNADGSAINQLKTTTKTAVKDTTSKESLQAIAISAAAAGLAQGATQASGLTNATNGTNVASAPNTVAERITTNLSIGLQKAAIHSTSNIIATSAIKGQSLNQTIEEQGGGEKILINTALNALAETGAKEIGRAAHSFKTDQSGNILTNASGEQLHQINKATQLTLHGALGATISALRGNDNAAAIISGAAAAAVGELAADSAYSSGSNANKSIAIGQVAGSLAALTTSIAAGASDEQTASNIQLGNYLATNAAINNTLSYQFHEVKTEKSDISQIKDESKQVKLGIAGIKFGEIEVGLNGELKAGDYSIKLNSDQTVELKSGSYHGSLLIVPDNQEAWKNHPDFRNNFTADGKVYATIGGGPDRPLEVFSEIPNLHGGINRAPYDTNLSNKILTIQIPPSIVGNEDAKIQQFLNLNKNFENNPNKLNYWLFPNKDSNFYNSNSYLTGISKAANLPIPQIDLKAPGYDKPVPVEYFKNQNGELR